MPIRLANPERAMVRQDVQVRPSAEVSAVVTDLGGTIVRADGTVSAATRTVVAALRQSGIPLIVAMARTPAGLGVPGPMPPDVTMAVCCDGGFGWVPAAERTIWRDELSATTVKDIVSVIDRRTGLRRVLATLKIDPECAIGFGDAPNDLPMFAVLGYSVAVANAYPDVLAAAHLVTDSVERDGFARTIGEL